MWRGRLGIACLATMVTTGLAAPITAAGDETALTVEGVTSVARADLDGDGATELVVITTRDGARRAMVEVFGHGEEGWGLRATLPIPPVEPPDDGRPFRAGSDALVLLEWTNGGIESVLLIAAFRGNDPGGACCLSVDHLALRGDRLAATRLHADSIAPDSALALDFEGDGTDELILASEAREEDAVPPMSVLRFDGSAFRRMDVPGLAGMPGPSMTSLGDSDGQPGDELVLASADEPPRYLRLRTDGSGGLEMEEAPPVPATDPDEPMWIVSAGNGALLGHTPRGIHVLEWPRDAGLTSAVFIPSSEGSMVEPLGWSEVPALLAYDPAVGSLPVGMPSAVLDLDGEVIAELLPSPAVERLLRYVTREHRAFGNVGLYLYPFSGPLPGGLGDGTQVYFVAGQAIRFRPGGTVEVHPASALVDVGILGSVGPGAAWVAISDDFGWLGYSSYAWLYPGPPEGSAVHLVPTETLLATEPDGGRLQPAIEGAAQLPPDDDGRGRLATTAEGFTVTINGPTGSRVLIVRDHSVVRQSVLDEAPLHVTIVPRERDRDDHMDAAVLLFTPTGHAFGVDWSVDVLREEPAIQAAGRTRDGEWSVVVSGEATPGSTVTVDGAPVPVGADGAFSATVDAGLWPRPVSVVARDVLGREVAARVDVVGMVDYRSWPWVAILAATTVAIGAVLFVRTPARRERPTSTLADDGILEEIDAG